MLKDEMAASIVDRAKKFRYEVFIDVGTGTIPGMEAIVRIFSSNQSFFAGFYEFLTFFGYSNSQPGQAFIKKIPARKRAGIDFVLVCSLSGAAATAAASAGSFGFEARSASATRSSIGVLNLESAAQHVIDIINDSTFHVAEAEGINPDFHTVVGELLVVGVAIVVQGHSVLEAATTAPSNPDSQGTFRTVLTGLQVDQFGRGSIRDRDGGSDNRGIQSYAHGYGFILRQILGIRVGHLEILATAELPGEADPVRLSSLHTFSIISSVP
jgi:hypothetical protein